MAAFLCQIGKPPQLTAQVSAQQNTWKEVPLVQVARIDAKMFEHGVGEAGHPIEQALADRGHFDAGDICKQD